MELGKEGKTMVKMKCGHCGKVTDHTLVHEQYWRCTYCNKFAHHCEYKCLKGKYNRSSEVTFTNKFERVKTRVVCPCCKDHPQGDADDYLDCKNEFWVGTYANAKCVGQCGCYSPVHGKRDKDKWIRTFKGVI